eukprot:1715266-Rhodomonas_salina.2
MHIGVFCSALCLRELAPAPCPPSPQGHVQLSLRDTSRLLRPPSCPAAARHRLLRDNVQTHVCVAHFPRRVVMEQEQLRHLPTHRA